MKTDLGYIRGAQGEVGPQGETGAQGPAATIEVGSVTTSAYGTSPKVVNSGTENAARFDFTIPQGAPGETVADVSELTANFITESAESYPTYTTTEKMKVILGKIKKYLADLKSEAASLASKITATEKNITNIQTDVGGINTALTDKLDKTDVIANLTATTSGKALDATQGKALQDQITQLNSDLSKKLSFYSKYSTSSAPISLKDCDGAFIFLMNSFDGGTDSNQPMSILAYSRRTTTVNELISINGGTVQSKINVNFNKTDLTIDPKSSEWGGKMYIYIFKIPF